jgi:hypothetical protein
MYFLGKCGLEFYSTSCVRPFVVELARAITPYVVSAHLCVSISIFF